MANRVGLWLIGARGGVAALVALGRAVMEKDLWGSTGVVTELPCFDGLDLVPWRDICIAGHDIRKTGLIAELTQFQESSRSFEQSLISACRDDLSEIDARIRPGILENAGQAIRKLASDTDMETEATPRAKIEKVKQDLQEFAQEYALNTVVVVNLASTEPPVDLSSIPPTWDELNSILDRLGGPLPSSTLYAIAAMELRFAFVNFTPSLGSNCTAMYELAEERGVAHAGQDGKTGETLIKSAMAPVFANRHLRIMSWVGHNIFGNRDGEILDDPLNKQTKIASKDRLLREILGYDPQTHISIEYIRSLGDWKTAWDHIHFQGFLGTPMTLQFTWQGCDSILAAPLVLDLLRITERAHRAGQTGVLDFLACFFKQPMDCLENNFVKQFAMLERWTEQLRDESMNSVE